MKDRTSFISVATRVVVAIVVFLACSGLSLNSKDSQAHQDWLSLVLFLGNDYHFRATTAAEEDSDFLLTLDTDPTECGTWLLSVNITLDEFVPNDIDDIPVTGQMRVDRNPVTQAYFVASAERGDNTTYFVLNNFNRDEYIFSEIKQGQYLRIKLSLPNGGDIYMRFSLNGSNAAIKRAEYLCRQHAASRPQDKDYFEKQSPPKPTTPDESFF